MRPIRRLPEAILRLLAALAVGCLVCGIARAQELGFGTALPLNSDAETDDAEDIGGGDMEADGEVWVSVWGRVPPSEPSRIMFVRSENAGEEWTAPAQVGSETPTGDDAYPTVATDGSGKWMAVWQSYRDAMLDSEETTITLDMDGDLLFSLSNDEGEHWSEPLPLVRWAETDSSTEISPQVVSMGGGKWMVAWAAIGATVDIDDEPTSLGTDLDILFSRTEDDGATWSDPIAVNPDAATDGVEEQDFMPRFAGAGDGDWMLQWNRGEVVFVFQIGHDIHVARTTDDGVGWEPLGSILPSVDEGEMNLYPAIETNGAETPRWISAWSHVVDEDSAIQYSVSDDFGDAWTTPAVLSSLSGEPDRDDGVFQHLRTDREENWLAVWQSSGATSESLLGEDLDILMAASTDDGDTWSEATPLNSYAEGDARDDQSPRLAVGSRYWIAHWFTRADDDLELDSDWDLMFARSFNLGLPTPTPTPTPTPPGPFGFSEVQVLNTTAAADTGDDRDARVEPITVTFGTTEPAWMATWATSDTLSMVAQELDEDFDLVMSFSFGGYAPTWSPPDVVDVGHSSEDAGDDRDPSSASSGRGDLPGDLRVLVWETTDTLSGTIGSEGDILFAAKLREEFSFDSPSPLVESMTTDVGADHTPRVAWSEQDDGSDLFVAVWATSETAVLGDPSEIGTEGDLVWAWSEGEVPSEWSGPYPVHESMTLDEARDANPALACDGERMLLVWESDRESVRLDDGSTTVSLGDVDLHYSIMDLADRPLSWSEPTLLVRGMAGDDWDDEAPSLLRTPQAWICMWHAKGARNIFGIELGDDADVLFAGASPDVQSWGGPFEVNTNAPDDQGEDRHVVGATDGVNYLFVWESNTSDTLTGEPGADFDIHLAYSGPSYEEGPLTPPAPLNTNSETDVGDDLRPRVASDGRGNWMVVWESNEPDVLYEDEPVGPDFDLFFASSYSVGPTPSPTPTPAPTASPSPTRSPTPSPSPSPSPSPTPTPDPGVTPSPSPTVSPSPTISPSPTASPTVTPTPAVAVCVEAPDAFPSALHQILGLDASTAVGVAVSTGSMVACWSDDNARGGANEGADADILVSMSTDDGGTWSSPFAILEDFDEDEEDDVVPRIAFGPEGFGIVWIGHGSLAGVGSDDDVFGAWSEDGETWTGPVVLNGYAASDSVDDVSPHLAGVEGGWTVVWSSPWPGASSEHGTDGDIFLVEWAATGGAGTTVHVDEAETGGLDTVPFVATLGGEWIRLRWNGSGLQRNILFQP